MASYVMLQIAADNKETHPEAAKILERDRYMDDLIHSCQTADEAMDRIQQLEAVLKTGSFQVKQWFCSDETVRQKLNGIKKLNNKDQSAVEFKSDGDNGTKTLGIRWDPEADVIKFSVRNIELKTLTKRTVLSKIAMFYDPLGLASGVTIRARIALQDLWRLAIDWDEPIPQELHPTWLDLFDDLQKLAKVNFPRCIKPRDAIGEPELHVFGDASGKAYGGMAFLRWNRPVSSEVRLVMTKARVAPLRQTTVPRLELMAALICSRLAKTINQALEIKPSRVIFWSDSQVVLFWLRSESAILKPFVGLRVAEIQSTWGSDKFRYVPTDLNPADDLSRGKSVDQLTDRWFNGPTFLQLPESEWPKDSKITLNQMQNSNYPQLSVQLLNPMKL